MSEVFLFDMNREARATSSGPGLLSVIAAIFFFIHLPLAFAGEILSLPVESASIDLNSRGEPRAQVDIVLTDDGKASLSSFTEHHIGKRAVLLIDGKPLGSPMTIFNKLTALRMILAVATVPEAQNLALRLDKGTSRLSLGASD